jgi:hypothetical protein
MSRVSFSELRGEFWVQDGDTVRWFDTEADAKAFLQPRGYAGDFETHPVGTAARITMLEAENARLREALVDVTHFADRNGVDIARAALKGDE